jgi:competence protein ComEC
VLSSGARLKAGEVAIDVLHPPPAGPGGNENSRSLVLLIQHAGHSILLTGDLEGPGLNRVKTIAAPQVDVLMAPHHGNRLATEAMIEWAKPRLVVSCQGPPRSQAKSKESDAQGPVQLGTWPHGAITLRSRADSFVAETFVTQHRMRLQ